MKWKAFIEKLSLDQKSPLRGRNSGAEGKLYFKNFSFSAARVLGGQMESCTCRRRGIKNCFSLFLSERVFWDANPSVMILMLCQSKKKKHVYVNSLCTFWEFTFFFQPNNEQSPGSVDHRSVRDSFVKHTFIITAFTSQFWIWFMVSKTFWRI